MELFPGSFNEKLCEQLLVSFMIYYALSWFLRLTNFFSLFWQAHLKKWVEVITTGSAAKTNHSSEEVNSGEREALLERFNMLMDYLRKVHWKKKCLLGFVAGDEGAQFQILWVSCLRKEPRFSGGEILIVRVNYHHLTPPPKGWRSSGILCLVFLCKKCSLIAMTKS